MSTTGCRRDVKQLKLAEEIVVLGASTPSLYLYKHTGLVVVRVSERNFGFLIGRVVLRMTPPSPAVSIPILRERGAKSRRRS